MPRILVAPLDWGMGHSARCVCIINALQTAGATVIVACNDAQRQFLSMELSDVNFVHLQGYEIAYANSNALLELKIIAQIPKILHRIKSENKWLDKVIAEQKVDAVISDNRYGLYSTKIPCIFITHQIFIQAGIGKKLLENINAYFLNKFSECWIPDVDNVNLNLSGILSHGKSGIKRSKFIGPFSRFEQTENELETKQQLLIILSGPEPQRSILLQLILDQVKNNVNFPIMVAGQTTFKLTHDKVIFLGNVNTKQLQELISESELVVSRSGYTTIMDLAKLQKSALLIPTPKQTEQLYLANHVSKNNWHQIQLQHQLNIMNFINSKKNQKSISLNFYSYEKCIVTWMQGLSNK
jgi:uncharacterized protein (TIGR00661 family)